MKFLLLTITGWDEPPRARHQVARSLTKYGHVTYVAKNTIGRPRLSIRQVEDNLTVVTPAWPLDYRYRYRLPGLNELYQHWLLRSLRDHHQGSQIITFDHTAGMLHRYFADYTYFCNDDFIGNSSVRFALADRYHVHTEARVATNAKTVFATSPYLVDKLSKYNANVHELPLGAPSITDEELRACGERAETEYLRIGLVGFIGRRTPIEILRNVLKIDKSRLTLIGPVEAGFLQELGSSDSVRNMGVLTGDGLIREIHNLDVAIAPYTLKNVNRGGTPNKLWLYLATGRPVVVTELPNMIHWQFPPGCVYYSHSDDDFAEMVSKAYEEDSPALEKRRIAFARENTWQHRVAKMISLIA